MAPPPAGNAGAPWLIGTGAAARGGPELPVTAAGGGGEERGAGGAGWLHPWRSPIWTRATRPAPARAFPAGTPGAKLDGDPIPEHPMRVLALLSLLLVAGACATQAAAAKPAAASGSASVARAEPAANAASDTKWVCEKVRPVGSMFPEEQCREVKRSAQERREAQDAMLRAGRVSGPRAN